MGSVENGTDNGRAKCRSRQNDTERRQFLRMQPVLPPLAFRAPFRPFNGTRVVGVLAHFSAFSGVDGDSEPVVRGAGCKRNVGYFRFRFLNVSLLPFLGLVSLPRAARGAGRKHTPEQYARLSAKLAATRVGERVGRAGPA